jgi:hypothetical protein
VDEFALGHVDGGALGLPEGGEVDGEVQRVEELLGVGLHSSTRISEPFQARKVR